MSVTRINLTTFTPTYSGAISRIKLINQSVTGPAGADGADGAGVSVATKEGGTTKVAVTTVLDFDGTNFDVTGSSGTASIVIAAGQYDPAGTASSALASHVAAGDPHAQYALESALGTAATTNATAYATAAQGTTADNAVPKSLYDANTVLYATADNTPVALTVGASTFVGRKASGDISAMSAAEAAALLTTLVAKATFPETIAIACSDMTTAITTGTTKAYWVAPWACTLTAVKATLATAGTGTGTTIDINEGAGAGTSVLSTKLTIDVSETDSADAATAAVISDSAIAANGRITVDFDAVGTGAAGVIVYLTVTRAL